MTWLPQAYALALAAACAVYVLAGFYVLASNPRRTLGVPFFAMAVSMAVWAFALSNGGIAADPDAAVFWRRVAAVGWTTLFAFLLHFVLAPTGQRRVLAFWLTYPTRAAGVVPHQRSRQPRVPSSVRADPRTRAHHPDQERRRRGARPRTALDAAVVVALRAGLSRARASGLGRRGRPAAAPGARRPASAAGRT